MAQKEGCSPWILTNCGMKDANTYIWLTKGVAIQAAETMSHDMQGHIEYINASPSTQGRDDHDIVSQSREAGQPTNPKISMSSSL